MTVLLKLCDAVLLVGGELTTKKKTPAVLLRCRLYSNSVLLVGGELSSKKPPVLAYCQLCLNLCVAGCWKVLHQQGTQQHTDLNITDSTPIPVVF
jgi:hypothetical protein